MSVLSVLGFLKKVPIFVWVLVAAAGYFTYQQKQLNNARAATAEALASKTKTVDLLNGEWRARTTIREVQKDSLESQLRLAKETNTELLAAMNIHIQPDSVWRDSLVAETTVGEDSTRYASLRDSTSAGVLDLDVVAPPCCEDILISYHFFPNPINPRIALLRTDNNEAIFGVSWEGGYTEITTAFAKLPVRQKRVSPFVGGGYNFNTRVWNIQGGIDINLFLGISLEAFIEQGLGGEEHIPELLVAARKRF